MCHHPGSTLTFETLLTDPLVRLMMDADGVSLTELIRVMDLARDAAVARERHSVRLALTAPAATNAPA